jgi:2,4-dienoyl-CoA reductase-like NADH-dependent reductase (Old Yellow Enzyme family)
MLSSGGADYIVYGKLFTSNPDLPARFAKGGALTPFDASTFYSPGPKGYTDFASM